MAATRPAMNDDLRSLMCEAALSHESDPVVRWTHVVEADPERAARALLHVLDEVYG